MKPTFRFLFVIISTLLVSAAFGQVRVGKLGIGVRGDGYMFQADKGQKTYNTFGGGLDVNYSLWENIGIRLAVGGGSLQSKDLLKGVHTTSIFYGNFFVSGDFMPNSSFNPFIFAGGGLFYYDPRWDAPGISPAKGGMRTSFSGGAGVDYFLSEFISLSLSGEYVLSSTDNLDGTIGGADDSYQRISFGVRYYFFDQDFITKILKALEERYKK